MTLPTVPPEIVKAVIDTCAHAIAYGILLGSPVTDRESKQASDYYSRRDALFALIQQALAAEGERAIRAAIKRLMAHYLECAGDGFVGDLMIIGDEGHLLNLMLPEPKGGGA